MQAYLKALLYRSLPFFNSASIWLLFFRNVYGSLFSHCQVLPITKCFTGKSGATIVSDCFRVEITCKPAVFGSRETIETTQSSPLTSYISSIEMVHAESGTVNAMVISFFSAFPAPSAVAQTRMIKDNFVHLFTSIIGSSPASLLGPAK